LKRIKAHEALSNKKSLALGGLVPQFLQTKGTGPKTTAIDSILIARRNFSGRIHAFGIGGTATLHLACVLGLDSVDSAGWRNRAARGIIQLPGRGERLITQMGSWKGRKLDRKERELLAECECPGCRQSGIRGLTASGTIGFACRATHNLYVLLAELSEISIRMQSKTYRDWYSTHVFNNMFLRLIEYALNKTAARS
jgi:queuine/archaeosine tRNA-ribosyltransferase